MGAADYRTEVAGTVPGHLLVDNPSQGDGFVPGLGFHHKLSQKLRKAR